MVKIIVRERCYRGSENCVYMPVTAKLLLRSQDPLSYDNMITAVKPYGSVESSATCVCDPGWIPSIDDYRDRSPSKEWTVNIIANTIHEAEALFALEMERVVRRRT